MSFYGPMKEYNSVRNKIRDHLADDTDYLIQNNLDINVWWSCIMLNHINVYSTLVTPILNQLYYDEI